MDFSICPPKKIIFSPLMKYRIEKYIASFFKNGIKKKTKNFSHGWILDHGDRGATAISHSWQWDICLVKTHRCACAIHQKDMWLQSLAMILNTTQWALRAHWHVSTAAAGLPHVLWSLRSQWALKLAALPLLPHPSNVQPKCACVFGGGGWRVGESKWITSLHWIYLCLFL